MVLSAHFSEHRWKWKMVLSSSQRKRHRDDQRSPAVGINSPQIGKISPELCLTFFPPNVLFGGGSPDEGQLEARGEPSAQILYHLLFCLCCSSLKLHDPVLTQGPSTCWSPAYFSRFSGIEVFHFSELLPLKCPDVYHLPT